MQKLSTPVKPLLIIAAACIAVVVSLFVIFQIQTTQNASAVRPSDFNPGHIISDGVFYNSRSMTAGQIQTFLNSKVTCDTNGTGRATDWGRGDITRATLASYIRNGTHGYKKNTNFHAPPYTCLRNFKQNTPQVAAASGYCSAISAKSNRTAAQIIDDVAKACNINAQVLLVLLEKEQSLVTDVWPINHQYNRATGFACPDNVGGACDPAFNGFFRQVYAAARQFKVYQAHPQNYNYVAGRTNNILWQVAPPGVGNFHNSSGSAANARQGHCGYSQVNIQNQATAALYIYTPYRPNGAALNSYPGTGDGCSAYGNRNFWYLFSNWFGSTQGTPFFQINGSGRVYILGENNTYYHVTSPKVLRSYGFGINTSTISKYDSSYVESKTLVGPLPLIAVFENNDVYHIDDGMRRHINSRQTALNHGYRIEDAARLPQSIMNYFKDAGTLSNIIHSNSSGRIYLIEDGVKRHFSGPSAYNSGTPSFSSRPRSDISNSYIESLPDGSEIYAAGSLVQASGDSKVYLVINYRQMTHVGSPSLLKALGFKASDVVFRPADQVNQYQKVSGLTTFVSVDNGSNIRLLDSDSSVRAVPQSVATLYSPVTSNLVEVDRSMLSRYNAAGSSTKLLRENGRNEIYLIESGTKRHISSPSVMSRLGFNGKDVSQVDGYTLNQFTTGTAIK